MRVLFASVTMGSLLLAGCNSSAPSPATTPNPPAKTSSSLSPAAGDNAGKKGAASSSAKSDSKNAAPSSGSVASDSSGAKGATAAGAGEKPVVKTPDKPAVGTPPAPDGTAGQVPSSDPAKPSFAELMNKARNAAQSGDLPGAYAALKIAHELDGKNRIVIVNAIQIGQAAGMKEIQGANEPAGYVYFLEGAGLARKLQDLGSLSPQETATISGAIYNEACVLSKTAKLDEAIKSLGAALDLGFSDLKLLDEDPDLAALRDLEAFKELRAKSMELIAAKERLEAEKQKKEILTSLANSKPFDFDFELPDVDAKPTKLSDLKGKVVIVDIWGTWCPPCKKEIPHFVELHKKYKEKGLEIIGINYENGSNEEAVALIKEFIAQNGMTYTCVLGDEATRKQVPDFQGYPTTIFIDRSGKVRLKEVGYKPLAVLETVVTTLLDESATQ